MIGFLVTPAIVVIVLVAFWYLASMLPPPFQPFVRVVFVIIAVIVAIWLLLQLPGLLHATPHLR